MLKGRGQNAASQIAAIGDPSGQAVQMVGPFPRSFTKSQIFSTNRRFISLVIRLYRALGASRVTTCSILHGIKPCNVTYTSFSTVLTVSFTMAVHHHLLFLTQYQHFLWVLNHVRNYINCTHHNTIDEKAIVLLITVIQR